MSVKNDMQPIGRVVGGSLSKNLQIRLETSTSVEDITVGTYLTISGSKARILGIVVDISIGFTLLIGLIILISIQDIIRILSGDLFP